MAVMQLCKKYNCNPNEIKILPVILQNKHRAIRHEWLVTSCHAVSIWSKHLEFGGKKWQTPMKKFPSLYIFLK
jgi:hypothetical protein